MVVIFIIFILIILYKFHLLKNSFIVVTNRRLIGTFDVGLFSKDKLDIPLRAIDSFIIDDSFFGNIFGYTNIKIHSRSSKYTLKFITIVSAQRIKDAYYLWDENMNK